ncbi:MAG: hypothetical protein ACLTG4_05720 [Oscillospiraceae bacterium]
MVALKADALPLVGRLRHFVGCNNRQNDQLSLKTARRDDLWLHVQKFHGTHYHRVRRRSRRTGRSWRRPSLTHYPKRASQNVPADVTPVRCLRKPNGAKPGMVCMTATARCLSLRMPPSPPASAWNEK